MKHINEFNNNGKTTLFDQGLPTLQNTDIQKDTHAVYQII